MIGIRDLHGWTQLVITALIIGIAPALIIVALFDLSEQQLSLLGTQLAPEFDAAHLVSTLISVLGPLLSLLPLAAGLSAKNAAWKHWPALAAAPACVIAPSWIAATAVGAEWQSTVIIALLLLCLVQINLTLWSMVLVRRIGATPLILLWAVFWVLADLVGYLRDYLLPYMQDDILRIPLVMVWAVPPILGANRMADLWLVENRFPTQLVVICTLQAALLTLLLIRSARRPVETP